VALARQIHEAPPELALRADTKKPGASPGFRIWWCNRTLDHNSLSGHV